MVNMRVRKSPDAASPKDSGRYIIDIFTLLFVRAHFHFYVTVRISSDMMQ